jgi:hypothetical protein
MFFCYRRFTNFRFFFGSFIAVIVTSSSRASISIALCFRFAFVVHLLSFSIRLVLVKSHFALGLYTDTLNTPALWGSMERFYQPSFVIEF